MTRIIEWVYAFVYMRMFGNNKLRREKFDYGQLIIDALSLFMSQK